MSKDGYKDRREDGEEGRSSWANLENVESRTGRGMRVAEHAVTDLLRQTHNSAHSTDDVMRQNDGDEGQAKHAGTMLVIRRSVVERGLVNHPRGNMPSLSSTSASSADCVTRWTVERVKEQNGHCHEYKYYVWVILTSVFKLTLRMQAVIPMLV